jgi:hypothetical protein
MMAGVILLHEGDPARVLPRAPTRAVPGPNFDNTRAPKELARVPNSLVMVVKKAELRLEVPALLESLTHPAEGSPIGSREAAAAIETARQLGFIAYAK